MLRDFFNIIATIVLAYGALKIASQANIIANRLVRVEADKHIFEWGSGVSIVYRKFHPSW